jgi:YVTN family beta-propeller protein
VLTITVGDGSRGVKVTDNGLLVVVTNEGDDSVSIVDARTNTVAATVPVGGGPTHVDIA